VMLGPLVESVARRVAVSSAPIPQTAQGVVLAEVRIAGRSHRIAIDYSDYAEHIDEASAADVLVYFKLQHRAAGYSHSAVVPAGYVPADPLLYRLLPALRALRREPPLYDVHARFGLDFARDVRARALARLAEAGHLQHVVQGGRVRYSRFLREIACSRVCVDLPGNGAFCFRLVEYLAAGCCIAGIPHDNRMHVPLVPGEHFAAVDGTLDDLVAVCERLVAEPAERERLARSAADYFDRYLHRDQLAGYFLRTILDCAG